MKVGTLEPKISLTEIKYLSIILKFNHKKNKNKNQNWWLIS